MGGAQGQDPRLREAQQDESLRAALRHQLQDEKVLDFLASEAKIEESTGT